MSTLAPPSPREITVGYKPTPQQYAFHSSPALVRGYGGAMGGGKSRAMCEDAFFLGLNHPGLKTLICRQAHTSIVETTKKTMMEQVIPSELRALLRKRESAGEDWQELPNGSRFSFIGLEDPVRWFSSEIGLLVFDEAHEIAEDTVVKLMTRLRQRCPDCQKDGVADCAHLPNRVMIGFNPENPGHWLQRWFYVGAARTEYGFYKKQLYSTGADDPLGDAEFVFARAIDNPYLSDRYIRMLKGMRGELRERYLEGKWTFVSGTCFFSVDALEQYRERLIPPKVVGHTEGKIDGRPRFVPKKGGNWAVWKTPVRRHFNDQTGRWVDDHRYIASVDVSSGGSVDYSAIQVVDVDTFEQVARFQGKLDPDLVAVEAARIGRIYNNALVAPEITGGWGFSVVKELQRLRYGRFYTRPVLDRLSQKYTDKVGWDTTTKTRALMLDTLERVLREQEFELYDEATFAELGSFVRDDAGRPAAQPGMNDDLVTSLAIGVTLATQLPRQVRQLKEEPYTPQYAATGW